LAINLKKKAKKIIINIAEATATELLKELILHRIFRRKRGPEKEEVEVPCGIVDRFKSYFLKEFEPFFSRVNSQNLMSIIHQVCSPIGQQSEITNQLNQLERDYGWVDREYSDVMLAFRDYEEYGHKEFFERTTERLLKALKRYVDFAKPLNELLLAFNNPETLKHALKTIDTIYLPAQKHFNKLIYDYYRFAIRNKEYVHTKRQYEAMLMYLPEIPSKENLATLTKITQKETIVEKL